MTTQTDPDLTLVERLLHGPLSDGDAKLFEIDRGLLTEAADALTAMQAENERLREAIKYAGVSLDQGMSKTAVCERLLGALGKEGDFKVPFSRFLGKDKT